MPNGMPCKKLASLAPFEVLRKYQKILREQFRPPPNKNRSGLRFFSYLKSGIIKLKNGQNCPKMALWGKKRLGLFFGMLLEYHRQGLNTGSISKLNHF
jgi:hypothetical protein